MVHSVNLQIKENKMILYYTEIEDMDYSWYNSHLELLQDYLTGENL